MMIHKITPSADLNQLLKRLDTQLYKTTNKKSMKVPKVMRSTNKKTLLYNFWDYCNTHWFIPTLQFPLFFNVNQGQEKNNFVYCIRISHHYLKISSELTRSNLFKEIPFYN